MTGISPDPARTPACRPAPAGHGEQLGQVRLVVCYDGWWFKHASDYFTACRGEPVRVAGLHDAIRWHAAGVYGCPVQQVVIAQAHHIAGRTAPSAWDEVLDTHAITRHDVPVTRGKGEVGADVELALTCYQAVLDTNPAMVVLLAGDGDFAPLAARLAGRGLRVLVPRAGFSTPASNGDSPDIVATSGWLTSRATDTPPLADLLDAALAGDYPPFLARPFTGSPSAEQTRPRRRGTITTWPPGGRYGFLADDSGQTWWVSSSEVPARTLPAGARVSFTGNPHPAAGRRHPAARDLQPVDSASEAAPSPAAGGGGTAPDPAFTPREARILAELCRHRVPARPAMPGEIAAALGMKETSIYPYLARLCAKLGVSCGTGWDQRLAATAARRGLIPAATAAGQD